MYPEANCRFTPSHEWVFVTGDVATVGISNHAQKEISDIVFIELPKVGAKVTQGKPCAVIGVIVFGMMGQHQPRPQRGQGCESRSPAVLASQPVPNLVSTIRVEVRRLAERLGVHMNSPLKEGAIRYQRDDLHVHPRYCDLPPTLSLLSRLLRCSPSRMNSTAAAVSGPELVGPSLSTAACKPSIVLASCT